MQRHGHTHETIRAGNKAPSSLSSLPPSSEMQRHSHAHETIKSLGWRNGRKQGPLLPLSSSPSLPPSSEMQRHGHTHETIKSLGWPHPAPPPAPPPPPPPKQVRIPDYAHTVRLIQEITASQDLRNSGDTVRHMQTPIQYDLFRRSLPVRIPEIQAIQCSTCERPYSIPS